MSASKPQESGEVRIGHSLNEEEEEFVARRRNTVLQCLQKFKIRCSQNAVPNIALLGSGGGQRAMVGLLGSLVQLDKAGLLDCILYLSGVSGSTWCMASLYQEADWSTKLETVKDKIIRRLSGPGVRWTDALAKLKKYYYGKDIFSLTDVWAVMLVTTYVKEIDECKLSEQWEQHSKDPFPIYTVIDKQCKQREEGDPWFEISPHEAGYSLIGAFVETSSFGSKFKNTMKKQDEMDMLYLQALCSSVLADEEEIWKWIKALLLPEIKTASEKMRQDPHSPPTDKCYQVLLNLVDMNLAVLKGTDPSALDQSIRTTLTDLSGGQSQLICQLEKLNDDKTAGKKAAKQHMMQYTVDVCNYFSLERKLNSWPFDLLISICRCIAQWIWGRHYNFLHNMTDEAGERTLFLWHICVKGVSICWDGVSHVFDSHPRTLVYDDDAVPVGRLQDLLGVGIVTGAERVHSHPLHQIRWTVAHLFTDVIRERGLHRDVINVRRGCGVEQDRSVYSSVVEEIKHAADVRLKREMTALVLGRLDPVHPLRDGHSTDPETATMSQRQPSA
uniref:PLA2c domain-containing protein n=1 Tax=Cyprinus carpio TaxID=7962 RepID=A0A8C2KB16_CYPCA